MGHPAKAEEERDRQGIEPCLFLVAEKWENPQKVGSKLERRERACKRTVQAQRDFLRGGAATRTVKPHFAQKNAANHKGSPRRGCGGRI